MSFLGGSNNIGNQLINAINNGSTLDQGVNQSNNDTSGFSAPFSPSADGSGLPSSKIPPLLPATSQRDTIRWFIPEIGIINMYINPQNIQYTYKKLITPERTKGGYTIQYWGEELTVLHISGHTGSSGVEGLNVLEEIYRSEQLLFDPLALTMAAQNSISGVNDLVSGAIGNLLGGGGLGQTISSVTNGIIGLDPLSSTILPQNIPTLASMALGLEMYYAGWVFHGYFMSFSFRESVEQLGLFTYDIDFYVTQKRGYRLNQFSWQRSANSGPSNNSPGGVPLSFSGIKK